jgi:hypothetical protein
MGLKGYITMFLCLVFGIYSCELAGGIFKAGFFSAVIIGVLLIVLIIWLVNRSKRQ